MTTQPEQVHENNLISQLTSLGHDIRTEKNLLANFKAQLGKHNQTRFSDAKLIREKQIDVRDKQIEEILSNIDNILNSTPNEEAIDNIHDADSLSDLFARFYPDNPRAGQGSD